MKSGDIYFGKLRVWSEEECADPNINPSPDEIFRNSYIKLAEHKVGGKNTCGGDAWACFEVDKLENLEDIENETNVTYCTEYIRKHFRRVYNEV